MTAAELAHALGGTKEGRQWRCNCPMHGGDSLMIRDGRNGNVVLYCFGGCEAKAIFSALRGLGLMNGQDYEWRPPEEREPEPEPAPIEKINAVWQRGRRIQSTLAETYLKNRDLDPALLDPDTVRFLPATEKYPPSLVAKLTSFANADEVRGLQFTRLTPDGWKEGDRTFMTGTKAKGAVIRLVTDVYDSLGLAEGLETALAIMTGLKRGERMALPVWAACGKGNLQDLPVLPGIERLTVYADADATASVRKLAARWHVNGVTTYIARRPDGDWNDGSGPSDG